MNDKRDKLLQEIMNLEDDNAYKKALLSVSELYECGKIDEERKYFLQNYILTEYDFGELIPKEISEINQRRNSILDAPKYGEKSGVPIQNPDDALEVAVKNKVSFNQVFPKGFNGLYRAIGVKNLGMQKRDGTMITDVKQFSGGKQKDYARRIVSQYVQAERIPNERYAIQIADIYIEPILEMFDGRGRHSSGYYLRRLIPFMIGSLLNLENAEDDCKSTNINNIARNIGLVKEKYRSIKAEEAKKNDERFTKYMLNLFYCNANREIERIIFRLLDELQSNRSMISYEKNFSIQESVIEQTENGTKELTIHRTSSKEETSIIRQAQSKVLREFRATGMNVIFLRNQSKKFYERVVELINETYGFGWVSYKNQIEIKVEDSKRLRETYEEYKDEYDLSEFLYEAKQRLIRTLHSRIQSDYENSNRRLTESDEETKKRLLKNKFIDKDIKDLLEMGIYDVSDMEKYGLVKKYIYHQSTLETQHDLIDYFIGKMDYDYIDTEDDNLFS